MEYRGNVLLSVVILYRYNSADGIIVTIDPEKKRKIDNFVDSLLSEFDKRRNVVGNCEQRRNIVHIWIYIVKI